MALAMHVDTHQREAAGDTEAFNDCTTFLPGSPCTAHAMAQPTAESETTKGPLALVSALENDRYGYYNRTEEELEEELDTILNVENKCLRWNVIWVLMFAIILLFLPFWLFLLLLPLSREVSTSVPSINSAVAFLALMVVNLWCALVLMYATVHVVLTMRTLMKYTRMSNVEEWERYELQERQGWPLRCFTVCSWRIWKGLCCWVCNLRKDDALTEPLLQDDHEADLEQRRPAHPRLAQQYCGAGGDHTKLRERLRHVVVMVSYKEPLALMERTLDSVASQTIAQVLQSACISLFVAVGVAVLGALRIELVSKSSWWWPSRNVRGRKLWTRRSAHCALAMALRLRSTTRAASIAVITLTMAKRLSARAPMLPLRAYCSQGRLQEFCCSS
eukprot:scaffold3159_cov393-Prasinococcus_capsulatus_cf.AAC.18